MGRAYVCPVCHSPLPKGDEGCLYKKRHYHKTCYEQIITKDELHEYICRLFNIKAPGPRNFAMISKYMNEKGYTYKGILNALKFFYDIQKHSTEKANNSIGIVPYVYDDAQQYFENLENKQEQVANEIKTVIQQETQVVKIAYKKEKKRTDFMIDLENLVEE